jgi:hypothetical protein
MSRAIDGTTRCRPSGTGAPPVISSAAAAGQDSCCLPRSWRDRTPSGARLRPPPRAAGQVISEDDAEYALVTIGSVTGAAKDAVDEARAWQAGRPGQSQDVPAIPDAGGEECEDNRRGGSLGQLRMELRSIVSGNAGALYNALRGSLASNVDLIRGFANTPQSTAVS